MGTTVPVAAPRSQHNDQVGDIVSSLGVARCRYTTLQHSTPPLQRAVRMLRQGSLQIGDCSPSLQDGGFFVAENVTEAIFDSVAQPAVRRIQAAEPRCEFRSVIATVRMVAVEKCVAPETVLRASSPRGRQRERVETLRSLVNTLVSVNGSLKSERITELGGSVESLLHGLTLLLGTNFDEQPLRVLLLRSSIADACVWAGLFASAHIVAVSAEGDEASRTCSAGSNPKRAVSWQPTTNETFDVVVDSGSHFEVGSSDTGLLVDALSRVALGGYFIATGFHPWAAASSSDSQRQIFVHLAMQLASDALPHELSDVLSIHIYDGSVFMQKVRSVRRNSTAR
jgi:hypothetical protein